MIRLFTFLLALASLTAAAQTDGLTYQAVIIDPNPQEIPGVDLTGNVLSEGEVQLRFSILHDGSVEYQELHQVQTDRYGMVNVVIGAGESTGAGEVAWNEIDWDGTPRQLGVEIAFTEDDYEDFGQEELYFIPYAYHRNITATGTLQVTLDAQFDSNVNIDGTLDVGGATTLNSTLDVAEDASFEQNIAVAGNGTLDGSMVVGQDLDVIDDLNVFDDLWVGDQATIQGVMQVDGNAYFANNQTVHGNQVVNGDTFLNGTSALNGQVTITADVNGSDSNWDNYPLRVQGSNQGVAIRLDGAVDEAKNFLLFQDQWGGNHGRIEGQTPWQLFTSWRYLFDITSFGVQSGLAFAEAAACGVNVPPDVAEVFANNVLGGTLFVMGGEYIFNYNLNIGVSYLSGSADYAEYLPRQKADEVFYPGEVVGVYAGEISHTTAGADHLLVISTAPAVLGNMPPDAELHLNEKVAFLGQVPVRVAGPVNEGDYIVASGNHDGFAVAVAAEDLPTARFSEIIGVSWEAASNPISNTVNVAIGLQSNDLAHRVADLEQRLDRMEALLAGKPDPTLVQDQRPAVEHGEVDLEAAMAPFLASEPTASDAEIQAWVDQVGPYVEREMMKVRMHLKALGADYHQYPEIALLIDHPAEALAQMQRGELLPSMWASMKQHAGR